MEISQQNERYHKRTELDIIKNKRRFSLRSGERKKIPVLLLLVNILWVTVNAERHKNK